MRWQAHASRTLKQPERCPTPTGRGGLFDPTDPPTHPPTRPMQKQGKERQFLALLLGVRLPPPRSPAPTLH